MATEVALSPLLFYQKPEIGTTRSLRTSDDNSAPLQLAFPDGSVGLGVLAEKPPAAAPAAGEDYVAVVISGPEDSEADINDRRAMKTAFYVTAFVNIVLTSILFACATTTDPSLVEPYSPSSNPGVFTKVSSVRITVQSVSFGFVIASTALGCISAACENSLGLSAYALAVILNVVLGTSALPYFVYSLRYVIDIFLLYFALVLRSKVSMTFLPTHIHRH